MPYAWRCLATGLLHVGPGYPQPSQAPATFCGFKCQTQMGHTKPVPQDRECTSSSALVMPINFFFHPQRHQKPIFLVNLARLVHYNAASPAYVTAQTSKWKAHLFANTHRTAGSGVAVVAFPMLSRQSCLMAVSAHPRRYTNTQKAASLCRPTVCTWQTYHTGQLRFKKKNKKKRSIYSLLLTMWPKAVWLHAACLCLAYQQCCKSL